MKLHIKLLVVTLLLGLLAACTQVGPQPTGEKQGAESVTALFHTGTPLQAEYSATTVGGPTWRRPVLAGPNLSNVGTNVPYHVQAFYVLQDGLYEIYSAQDYDGYLHLYENRFDPEDQLTNLLAGNDDFSDFGDSLIHDSLIQQNLTRGTLYLLVTSGYSNTDAGNFTNSFYGEGGVLLAKQNNQEAFVDVSSATRSVTFSEADFGGPALVGSVLVTLDFEKISGGGVGSCPVTDGGFYFNLEIYYYLTSPTGTRVVLIESFNNLGGSGAGETYTSVSQSGGRVQVSFDDAAATQVGGAVPETGVFRPVQPLSAFAGEDAVGEWVLTIGDAFFADPLCHFNFSMAIAPPQADLDLSKTVSSSEALAGEPLTYTLTVTNLGPNPATNVTITDDLDPIFASFIVNDASFALSYDPGVPVVPALTIVGNEVGFTLLEPALAPNESLTLTIVATPQQAGAFTNTATVTGEELDPDPSNNTASVTVTVLINIITDTDLGTLYLMRVVNLQLDAFGGVAPCTWSSPDLQFMVRGLSLTPDGRIIGRPLQRYATPRTFTVFVTDANGMVTEQQFTVVVR